MTMRVLAENESLKRKIEAVKTRIDKYEKTVTLPDPADLSLIEDIKKIIGVEE
ncbi:hypothetical protein ES702_02499 [subsurface metagenome]